MAHSAWVLVAARLFGPWESAATAAVGVVGCRRRSAGIRSFHPGFLEAGLPCPLREGLGILSTVEVQEADIPGARLLPPVTASRRTGCQQRGFLAEVYYRETLWNVAISENFVQENHTILTSARTV